MLRSAPGRSVSPSVMSPPCCPRPWRGVAGWYRHASQNVAMGWRSISLRMSPTWERAGGWSARKGRMDSLMTLLLVGGAGTAGWSWRVARAGAGRAGACSVAGGCGDGHASGDDEVWVLQGLELFEWVAADADEVGGGAFDELPERR